MLPGVSQIQRNHGTLEVHWSSKDSPDLKKVPDCVESVMDSLAVTAAQQQEMINTDILHILDCFTGLFTPRHNIQLLFFLPKEKRRYGELRVSAGWVLSGRKVTHLAREITGQPGGGNVLTQNCDISLSLIIRSIFYSSNISYNRSRSPVFFLN